MCTGHFPKFKHSVPLLAPEPIEHFLVSALADGQKIGIMLPEEDQIPQNRKLWNDSGVTNLAYASATPYGDIKNISTAGLSLKEQGATMICLDCMGFSLEMKKIVSSETNLPVIIPRTLCTSVLREFLSQI